MRPRAWVAGVVVLCLLAVTPAWAQGVGTESSGDTTASAAKKDPAEKKPATKPEAKDGKAAVSELKSQDPPPSVAQGTQPPAAAVEPGYFQIEFKYNIDSTALQGNKSRSFLWEGRNHTGESNYIFSQPLWEGAKFEHVGAFRYTDNPRVDPERNSLQRMFFRMTGKTLDGSLGDALVNYSRFSFNQNIKGLHVWKDVTRTFRVTGTVGYFADRWGTLYRPVDTFRNVLVDCQADSVPANLGLGTPAQPAAGCVETSTNSGSFVLDPGNPLKPYSRFVAGARAEKKFGRSSWVALNWSHGKDLQQSLPSAKVTCDNSGVIRVGSIFPGCNQPGEVEVTGGRRPGTDSTDNDVFSVDAQWDYAPWKLHMAGEIASGWTLGGLPPTGATPSNFICPSQSPIIGAKVLDSRCFSVHTRDSAYRAEASQRIGKLTLRADYSRFNPNFVSINARQIRDLEDFAARGEYEIIPQVTLAGSFRRSTDNLNSQRNFTNIVRAPEGKLILRDLPFYRRMSMEIGYRERNQDMSGNPLVTCSAANPTPPPATINVQRPHRQGCQPGEVFISTEARKRSTRIPFFSLSLPAGDNFITFDYEHRRDSDAVRPPQSSDTDRFAIGFRGNYTISDWDVSPSLRFEIERLDKNLSNNPALPISDPTLIFPIDFFTAWDTNRSYQASLLIEAPKYWRIEAYFRQFNSVVLVPTAPANVSLGLLYLNQGFRRPNWRGVVTYKIANDENKTITLFYERSNNFFFAGDPALADTKSFRETVIGGTLFLRFRK